MPPYFRTLALALVLPIFVAGCNAGAQTPGESAETAAAETQVPLENVLDAWMGRLRAADQALHGGRWQPAREGAEAVLAEMTDAIQGGNRAAPLMAMASLFRAIARTGQGEPDDAIWDWAVAEGFHAPFAQTDLAPYGDAGAALANRLEQARLAAAQAVDLTQPEMADPSIVPPARLDGPAPHYPASLKAACVEGTMSARALIDEQGRPTLPSAIESPGGPPMAHAALEAMRHWTFSPATLDGRPIPAFFRLSIRFELEDCHDGEG